jgi:hypothetical protein
LNFIFPLGDGVDSDQKCRPEKKNNRDRIEKSLAELWISGCPQIGTEANLFKRDRRNIKISGAAYLALSVNVGDILP